MMRMCGGSERVVATHAAHTQISSGFQHCPFCKRGNQDCPHNEEQRVSSARRAGLGCLNRFFPTHAARIRTNC